MGYEAMFWSKFLETFAPTLGAVLGLLPGLLLGLGTIALALRLHHQRVMTRVESARQALRLEADGFETDQVRRDAQHFLWTGL
jgi:hypothetical protein